LIFLDTGFLFALFDEDDKDHLRVREVAEKYRSQFLPDFVLTTNHVIAETITLVRSKGHADLGVRHDRAVKIGQRLWAGHLASVHHATPEEEQAAFVYFTRHRDKEYSFVDCVSFVLMDSLGIREAFAVDRDFTHRFVALPGPKAK
jgi:predicted nucleic acid-binding protein